MTDPLEQQRIQELFALLQRAQEELNRRVLQGSAGGGLVSIKLSAWLEVEELRIHPRAVDPNQVGRLHRLVEAALGEALSEARRLAALDDALRGARNVLESRVAPTPLPVGSAGEPRPAAPTWPTDLEPLERRIPDLVAEAERERERLPSDLRLGADWPFAPLPALIRALLAALPRIMRPAGSAGMPAEIAVLTVVRAEALQTCALLLEALAGVRCAMGPEHATERAEAALDSIVEHALHSLAAPGLPSTETEWTHAIGNVAVGASLLLESRLGEQGPGAAHDALERAGGHAFCALGLVDLMLDDRDA